MNPHNVLKGIKINYTVCPRISDPFYIVSFYTVPCVQEVVTPFYVGHYFLDIQYVQELVTHFI